MPARAGTAFVDFRGDFAALRREVSREVGPLTSRFSQLGRTATRGLSGASKSTQELGRHTSILSGTLGTAAKAAAGAAAAYIGISQISSAITATEDLAKVTIGLHKNLGLSVHAASEWGAQLQARGADAKQAQMAFATMAGAIRQAREGSTSAVANFKALGISQQELKKTSPEQTLGLVADGLDKLGGSAAKADVQRKLFGRGWQTVGPILRDGSKSMQDQLSLADKYGATFSGKSVKSVQDLIATQRELKIAQLGLQVQFTRDIAPALIKVGLGFAHLINAIRQLHVNIGSLNFSGVINSLREFWRQSGVVRTALAGLGRIAKEAFGAIGSIVKSQLQTITGVVQVFTGVLTGDWGRAWKGLKNIVSGTIKGIVGFIRLGFSPVAALISDPFGKAVGLVRGFINSIIDVINVIPGVDIGHVGGGASVGSSAAEKHSHAGGGPQRHATGGMITAPMVMVGEEAPTHPEYVLATNPAYRQRNKGLWAAAGRDLGIPGFAKGGSVSLQNLGMAHSSGTGSIDIGSVLPNLPSPGDFLPDWLSGMGDWMISHVASWAKGKLGGAVDKVTGFVNPFGGGGPNIPGFARGGIVKGKVSVFGPPLEGAGQTASGVSSSAPGIAIFDRSRLGKLWDIIIGAHKARLKQTDIGPAPWTGRKIDVTGAGSRVLGINPSNFPTDSLGKAIPVGAGAAHKPTKGKGTTKATGLGLSPELQAQINTSSAGADLYEEYASRANTLEDTVFGQDEVAWLQQELSALFHLRNLLVRAVLQLRKSLARIAAGKVPDPGATTAPGGPSDSNGLDPRVVDMLKFGKAIDARHFPYVYGGGHASFSGPYDCSGFVSAILHAGGLTNTTMSTDPLKTWGRSGPGEQVTIGVRGSSGMNAHTMMRVGSAFFESGGGHGAAKVGGWDGSFPIKRHPPGLAKGGIVGSVVRKVLGVAPETIRALMDPDNPNFVGYGLRKGGLLDFAKKGKKVKQGKMSDALKSQRDALTSKLGDVTSTLQDVQGLGGGLNVLKSLPPVGELGGRIFDVQSQLRDAGASSSATDSTTSDSSDLLRQLLQQAQTSLAVSQAQYPILRQIPQLIGAPFAGSFGGGGVIDGPYGAPRSAIVHGGEGVFTPDQMDAMGSSSPFGVTVVVEDGAVDPSKISTIVHSTLERESSRARRRT